MKESTTLLDAIKESMENWSPNPNSRTPPPVMIVAMNVAFDRYPKVEAAMNADDESDPGKEQYRNATQRYMTIIDAFYDASGEYPTSIGLPKPTNDSEKCVWMMVEGFLHYKTGKKPILRERN